MVARQVVSWVFAYALKHQATHLLIAFDGSECFRYKVWPLYKSSRKQLVDHNGNVLSTEEAQKLLKKGTELERAYDPIYECQILTESLVEDYKIHRIHIAHVEADDVLASAAALGAENPDEIRKVVMVAADKDMLQGLRENTVQWYPNHDRTKPPVMITYKDLSNRLMSYVHEDAAKWTPLQFRDYQILIGDPIDDVPPIVAKAEARRILNKYPSLKGEGGYFHTKKGKAFYYSNQAELIRNYKLVVMKTDLLEGWSPEVFRYRPPALNNEQSVSASPQLRGAFADYTGWLRISSKRTLFG